jgi:hypothetical protein
MCLDGGLLERVCLVITACLGMWYEWTFVTLASGGPGEVFMRMLYLVIVIHDSLASRKHLSCCLKVVDLGGRSFQQEN